MLKKRNKKKQTHTQTRLPKTAPLLQSHLPEIRRTAVGWTGLDWTGLAWTGLDSLSCRARHFYAL